MGPVHLVGLASEPVAHTRLGDQVARSRGLWFQFAAQLSEVHAQVVGVGEVLGPRHLGQQLPVGDQAALMPDEDLQQAPFGAGQPDLGAVTPYLRDRQIDGERPV